MFGINFMPSAKAFLWCFSKYFTQWELEILENLLYISYYLLCACKTYHNVLSCAWLMENFGALWEEGEHFKILEFRGGTNVVETLSVHFQLMNSYIRYSCNPVCVDVKKLEDLFGCEPYFHRSSVVLKFGFPTATTVPCTATEEKIHKCSCG